MMNTPSDVYRDFVKYMDDVNRDFNIEILLPKLRIHDVITADEEAFIIEAKIPSVRVLVLFVTIMPCKNYESHLNLIKQLNANNYSSLANRLSDGFAKLGWNMKAGNRDASISSDCYSGQENLSPSPINPLSNQESIAETQDESNSCDNRNESPSDGANSDSTPSGLPPPTLNLTPANGSKPSPPQPSTQSALGQKQQPQKPPVAPKPTSTASGYANSATSTRPKPTNTPVAEEPTASTAVPSTSMKDNVEKKDRLERLIPDKIWNAEAYYIAAVSLQSLGKFQEAADAYGMATEYKRDFFEAYNNRGVCLADIGKYEEAVEAFNVAIQYKKDFAEAHNNLGLVLCRLGKCGQAHVAYQMAIKYERNFADVYWGNQKDTDCIVAPHKSVTDNNLQIIFEFDFNVAFNTKGVALSGLSQYQKPIENKSNGTDAHLEALLGSNCDLKYRNAVCAAYYGKAIVYMRQGQNPECLRYLKLAVEHNPDYVDAYHDTGLILGILGNKKEALQSYDMAIKKNPRYHYSHRAKALILEELGEHEKAIAAFDECIKHKPTYSKAHMEKVCLLLRVAKLEQAVEAMKIASRFITEDECKQADQLVTNLISNLATGFYNQGLELLKHKNIREAYVAFDLATDYKPDLACAYKEMAKILKMDQEHARCIIASELAIKYQPNCSEAYYYKGFSLNELGKRQDAMKSLDLAIMYNPNYAEAYCNKGTVLYSMNMPAEASTAFRKAVELKPDYAFAYYGLGRSQDELGLLDTAIAAYNEAIKHNPELSEARTAKSNALIKKLAKEILPSNDNRNSNIGNDNDSDSDDNGNVTVLQQMSFLFVSSNNL